MQRSDIYDRKILQERRGATWSTPDWFLARMVCSQQVYGFMVMFNWLITPRNGETNLAGNAGTYLLASVHKSNMVFTPYILRQRREAISKTLEK